MTALTLPVAMIATAPAAAQFSDSYKFLKAVKDKDATAAKKLLDTPGTTLINVRDQGTGDAALHTVVRRRDLPWLGFLLQNGADAGVRDREGSTALLLAATQGFSEAVQVLIAVRSPVDAQNRAGETALIKAAQLRDATSIRMLLDAGANPDLTDNTGMSARTFAANDTRGGPAARLLKDAPARKSRAVQGPSL